MYRPTKEKDIDFISDMVLTKSTGYLTVLWKNIYEPYERLQYNVVRVISCSY